MWPAERVLKPPDAQSDLGSFKVNLNKKGKNQIIKKTREREGETYFIVPFSFWLWHDRVY